MRPRRGGGVSTYLVPGRQSLPALCPSPGVRHWLQPACDHQSYPGTACLTAQPSRRVLPLQFSKSTWRQDKDIGKMWQWTIKQTSYSENSNCEREKQKQELWAGIALLSDLPVPVEKSYSFKVQTLREDRSERVRLISCTKSVSWKSRRTGFLALLLAPVPTAQPSPSAFSAKPPRDNKAKPFNFYIWPMVACFSPWLQFSVQRISLGKSGQ